VLGLADDAHHSLALEILCLAAPRISVARGPPCRRDLGEGPLLKRAVCQSELLVSISRRLFSPCSPWSSRLFFVFFFLRCSFPFLFFWPEARCFRQGMRRHRRVPLVTSLPPQRRTHSSIPLNLNQMPYVPLIIPNALVVISSTFEDINQESVVVIVIYLIVIESRLGSLTADRKQSSK
jgi:hypothetical protein